MKTVRLLSLLFSGIILTHFVLLINAKDPLELKYLQVRTQLADLREVNPNAQELAHCDELMSRAEMCLSRSEACQTRMRAKTHGPMAIHADHQVEEFTCLRKKREELRHEADSLLEEILFLLQIHRQKA